VTVFLNQGAFTFTSTAIPLDRQANDVLVADVNHDGKADLIVAGTHDGADDLFAVDGAVGVLRGNGDGTFAAPVFYDTWRGATRIALGDFNRDGIADVATANQSERLAEDFCGFLWDTVSILPGNSDGTFASASSFSLGDQARLGDSRYRNTAWSLAAVDVNGDRHADLVASNGAILINQAPDPNWAPKVAISPVPASVPANESIALQAVASDVDHDALTYQWIDSGGQSIEPTPTPFFFSPGSPGRHTFTVIVDDGHGHTATSSVTVDFTSSGGTTPGTVAFTAPEAGATIQAVTPFTIAGRRRAT
jgi:hypothetical protein